MPHAEESRTLCAQNRREQEVSNAELNAFGEDPNPSSAQHLADSRRLEQSRGLMYSSQYD